MTGKVRASGIRWWAVLEVRTFPNLRLTRNTMNYMAPSTRIRGAGRKRAKDMYQVNNLRLLWVKERGGGFPTRPFSLLFKRLPQCRGDGGKVKKEEGRESSSGCMNALTEGLR